MLKAIQTEQVQQTAQTLLAFFDREDVPVPASQLEAIVSGKSLLRAIVSGQLVVAQEEQPKVQPPVQPPVEPVEESEEAA